MEKVLALYREEYFDVNVQHFHEKLQAEHGIKLSLQRLLHPCGKVDDHRRTQVGRALHELGVQMIPAYSPEASAQRA